MDLYTDLSEGEGQDSAARMQSLIPALFLEQLITGLLTLKSWQAPLLAILRETQKPELSVCR